MRMPDSSPAPTYDAMIEAPEDARREWWKYLKAFVEVHPLSWGAAIFHIPGHVHVTLGPLTAGVEW